MSGPKDTDTQSEDPSNTDTNPTREEILAEIIRIQEDIGVYPGRSEFEKHSELSRDDILRHFEWYSEAIKTARSATRTKTGSSSTAENQSAKSASDRSPGDGSKIDGPEEKQSEQDDEEPEAEGSEEHTANEAGASDQSNTAEEETGKEGTGSDAQRSMTVRITDNGNPLSGAEVTVNNPDASGGQTDEHGDVEIQIPADLDQVPVQITHRRWADKNIDTASGGDTQPHQLDVSQSEWDTDPADADTASDSESDDEASDTVSTILEDLDQLDAN